MHFQLHSIPSQYRIFNRLMPPIGKDKERTLAQILAEALADQSLQPAEALAQIHRLQRHKHQPLKTECFGGVIPPTRAAAKLMIFDYIETFHNRRRSHSAIGYQSPLAFEKQKFPPNRNN